MDVKLKLSNAEHKDLVDYCNLNDLLISSVVKDSFTTGFHIEKYGLLNSDGVEEKQVVKEVIVEKRVEIPVEVIKEVIVEKIVEVIKEVPVEKVVIKEIIKEIPVEKVVYITDQEEMKTKIFQKELEFDQQRRLFSTKTEEMENIFQNEKNELLLKIQQLELKEPEVREVEVIKEVEKTVVDNSKSQMLQETLQKIRGEGIEKDKRIKELEKQIDDIKQMDIQRGAVYLRGSNLNDTLYK